MVDPVPLPKTDPAESKQLDDEFMAEFEAGTIRSLNLPPLDPATDPFDQNYAWLNAPSDPHDAAFDALIGRTPAEWYELGGDALRRIVYERSMAEGSEEEIYLNWARKDFRGICIASGEDGIELIDMLDSGSSGMCSSIVYEAAKTLEAHPAFRELTNEQRVIASLIALKALQAMPAE